jgi:short-subunit dehydrogenase
MKIDLQGRTIAITGASSGIGRASALLCARAGMNVMVGARREDRLRSLVDQIRAEGGRAELLAFDVAEAGASARFLDATLAAFGSLYSVFANAGYGLERSVLSYTDEELELMFRTNFFASLDLMRLGARHMLAHNPGPGRGHVLVCSSCVSKIGLPNFAAYSASKAMQDHFGRAMRIELADRGVHVSTVHPIGTRTEFFDIVEQRSGGARSSIHTAESFKQPAETVARAVLACLGRPRGEVWTSFPMRLGLALSVLLPQLTDRAMMRMQRRVDVADRSDVAVPASQPGANARG